MITTDIANYLHMSCQPCACELLHDNVNISMIITVIKNKTKMATYCHNNFTIFAQNFPHYTSMMLIAFNYLFCSKFCRHNLESPSQSANSAMPAQQIITCELWSLHTVKTFN